MSIFRKRQTRTSGTIFPVTNVCYNSVEATTLDEAIAALRDPDVKHLIYRHAELDANDVAQLAPHLIGSKVESLSLGYNHIGDDGVAALAPYLGASSIKTLELDDNRISDVGIAALAPYLASSGLTMIFLGDNDITPTSFTTLAPYIASSSLTHLSLHTSHSPSHINDEAASVLKSSIPDSTLIDLNLTHNKLSMRGEYDIKQLCTANILEILRQYHAWQDGTDVTPELWQTLSRQVHGLICVLSGTGGFFSKMEPEAIDKTLFSMADKAVAQGFPVQDFILQLLPLQEATTWLREHGQPLTAADLLNPDGTFPQDRFICRGGISALIQHPELWENRAQIGTAIRSLPEAVQAILPTHQLLATLSRRDAATQQGRG